MVPKHQPVIYHATVHDIFRRSSQWSGCTMLHLPNCCQRKPRHPRKPSQVLLGDSSRNLRLINFLPKTCRRPKGHVVRTLGFKTCALHIYNICTVYIYINYMGEKTCHELETHRCMDGWYVYVWEFWGLSTDLGVGLTCSSETSPVNNWEIRSIQLQKALGRIGGHSYRIYFESSIGCSLWSFWLLQVANRVLRP